MNRIALGVSYNGASYHGWQYQNEYTPTIQGNLELALSRIADEPIRVTCAGRTDTGVHATNQVVHFTTAANRQTGAWVSGTNSHLPDSIAVFWADKVPDDFDARFSAVSRRYLYVIDNNPVRSALTPDLMTHVHCPLDADKMHLSAQALLGENDFTSYRAANCQANTPMRRVHSITVDRIGDLVLLDITANAYLYHMVRNIVGVLLDVGESRKPESWPGELLALKDRTMGSRTAPPDGLFLIGVSYAGDSTIPSLSWPYFLHCRERD